MVARRGGKRQSRPQRSSQRGNPETRELLLDTAERLLADKGIGEITVGEIASEAELALGTFYIYFEDRFDILKQLVRRRIERIFDLAHEHTPRNLSTLARLTYSISQIFRSWERYSGVMRSLYQLSVQRADFLALQQELREPFARRMRAELELSIAHDHARSIDTRIAVDSLSTMLSWNCMFWFGLGLKPYPEATIDTLARQVALLWYRAVFGRDPADAAEALLPPAMLTQYGGDEQWESYVPSR